MQKFVLISIPILLVSFSNKLGASDLVCKQDGSNSLVYNVTIDLPNSTMTIEKSPRSIEITENEIMSTYSSASGNVTLINKLVINRRTLVMTSTNTLETLGEGTEPWGATTFSCELLPERQF